MRKILCLLGGMLLGALGVWAAPWGVVNGYVDEDTPSQTGEKFLLRKILNGQVLSVGLEKNIYTEERYEKLSQLIQDSYNDWFFNAARHIEQTGREAEFADILPILRQGIRLQIVEQGSDINFSFIPLREIQAQCGRGTGGCYTPDGAVPHIYLPSDLTLFQILSFGRETAKRFRTHEIGHSLGFSDQYFQARSINSDVMYGSAQERASVMQLSKHLTCDDADGMINLIDITRGIRRGGDKGWKTLCPQSQEYYVGGISSEKGPYRMMLRTDKGAVVLTTYADGKPIAKEIYPFATPKGIVSWQETPVQTVLKQDGQGRPIAAKGPQGEMIYYAYLYDRVEHLTVKDGRALSLITQIHYLPKQFTGAMKDYREVFFGQQGVVCLLRMSVLTKRGYVGEYIEGVNKSEIRRYVKRVYDQHGKLKDHVYQESDSHKKPGNSPTPAISSKKHGPFSGQELAEQLNTQLEVIQQDQLISRLDQWMEQTLQSFSPKTK